MNFSLKPPRESLNSFASQLGTISPSLSISLSLFYFRWSPQLDGDALWFRKRKLKIRTITTLLPNRPGEYALNRVSVWHN